MPIIWNKRRGVITRVKIRTKKVSGITINGKAAFLFTFSNVFVVSTGWFSTRFKFKARVSVRVFQKFTIPSNGFRFVFQTSSDRWLWWSGLFFFLRRDLFYRWALYTGFFHGGSSESLQERIQDREHNWKIWRKKGFTENDMEWRKKEEGESSWTQLSITVWYPRYSFAWEKYTWTRLQWSDKQFSPRMPIENIRTKQKTHLQPRDLHKQKKLGMPNENHH